MMTFHSVVKSVANTVLRNNRNKFATHYWVSCSSVYRSDCFHSRYIHSTEVCHAEQTTKQKLDLEKRGFRSIRGTPRPSHPVETSIRYLKSQTYKNVYGDKPVWYYYRRNHKGHLPPKKLRSQCVKNEVFLRGNPCPVCRDQYLTLDYRNVDLLAQFVDPTTEEAMLPQMAGLCLQQYKKLLLEIEKSRETGHLDAPLPFRLYDYSMYFSGEFGQQLFRLYEAAESVEELPSLAHVVEVEPAEVNIEPPYLPNRYRMEEEHMEKYRGRRKKRLAAEEAERIRLGIA